MQVRDIQKNIEDSLAKLPVVTLPGELEGLRHLPVNTHRAVVGIRSAPSEGRMGRKVREDASASYFNPDTCEVAIRFVPLDEQEGEAWGYEGGSLGAEDEGREFDMESALDQLINELRKAERAQPFVGLQWFRDGLLPKCGYPWTKEQGGRASVLRRALDETLVLTSQAPNPKEPMHPVTALRINRSHPRFRRMETSRKSGFKPLRIRGGAISDTVIGDRR